MLTIPTRDEAEHFLRTVDLKVRLRGGILTPMAGTRPVKLASLREVAAFLVIPEEPRALLHQAPLAQVHYVEPGSLIQWVRSEIGDTALADALDDAVDLRRPFGYLAVDIRSLLTDRLEQCESVLESDAVQV